ncbi:hypothetical protein HMPREF9104_01476 [Lentilactobacillus kisonensis F0435]|uniref:Uncharacterized protein n=1 Tax=Lentilactobacillus kisonensis F0435 TaxID=797516 RepID=H1LFV0_9LACO|nr:hypothetical protein HMPREF9104_01476 [Lentilactobacillus kisonensis F0435]
MIFTFNLYWANDKLNLSLTFFISQSFQPRVPCAKLEVGK